MANDKDKISVTKIFTQSIMLANEKALNVEDTKQTKEIKKVSKGIDNLGKESKTKAKEEKRERESFMVNLLENFQDAFVDAKSELTKPFKDASLTGLLKLVLAALPALAAGIIAGVFGDVTKLLGKLPGAQKLHGLFKWFAEFGGGKLGKFMSIFAKGGKLQAIGTFFRGIGRLFGFIGKMLKPVKEILKFGFKFIKPFFTHFGKIFKVFFKLGKAFSKFLLPISIVWSLVEAAFRSWDKFASGDILGGIGDFIGSIVEFFTFGLISMDDFGALFEGIFGNLIGTFEKLFSGDIVGALKDFGGFILNWFIGLPELVMDSVLNLLATVMDWVGLSGAGDFLRGLADFNIVDAIGDFFSNIWSILKSGFDVVIGLVAIPIEAVGDFFSWIFTQLKKSINGVINMLSYIPWIGDDIADSAKNLLGLGDDIQSIPSNTGLELQEESLRSQMRNVPPSTPALAPVQNNNMVTHVENNAYSQPPISARSDYNPHLPYSQW